MNTPAHLILGAALTGRGRRPLMWAAMAGALLPDLSLYVLAATSLFVLQIPPEVVFNELYFSDLWQSIFAVDNSFVLWGCLLALAVWLRLDWAVAFTGAGLLHLALDFPLHHDDGRAHFWPVSSWIFESPVSYWDRAHGARFVAPLEAAATALAALWVWSHRPGLMLSGLIAALLAAELYVVRTWLWFFAGG